MSDYGSIIADKAIAATAKKITSVYRKAAKELQSKLNEFTARFKEQQKIKLAQLEAGEITKSAYGSWLRGQVFIGNQWNKKLDQAVRVINDANNEAASLVKNGRLNVFAENYNYAAYELEKRTKGAVNFNIYNERTVENLIRKKPKMLPEWHIDEKKDYIWNRQKVENVITQGIIQGKKIDEIASDMTQSLCSSNDSKMMTFARTSITGAQNAGRQAQMEDAEEEGIKVKKRWVATLDNRTREAHQDLDGQEVPVDQPFTVNVDGEEMEIDYPGDPNAEPCLVYNCRCTMIQVYEGIDRKSIRRDMDDNEVENMTYKEWKKAKDEGTLNTEKKLVEPPIGKEEKITNEDIRSSLQKDNMNKGVTTHEIQEARERTWKSEDAKINHIIDRTSDNVEVTYVQKSIDPDTKKELPSHYSEGTGKITMVTEKNGVALSADDIALSEAHEYWHFVDDAKVSGSGYGVEHDGRMHYGIYNEAREGAKYEKAAVDDVNNFLNSAGLSEHYECKYNGTTQWVYKDGIPLDIDNMDDKTSRELHDSVEKWLNEQSGMNDALAYAKNSGYPEMPEYGDYAEISVKNGKLETKERYKGAFEEYYKRMREVEEERDKFAEKHDISELFKKQRKLVDEAQKNMHKLGYVVDTLDAATYGAFTTAGNDGHSSKYYRISNNGIKESVANTGMTLLTEDEMLMKGMTMLCPKIFELFKGIILK